MPYYLGVDIGTTSAKAVAFSPTGEVLASHSTVYPMYHPQPACAEQDPEEICAAIFESMNKVFSSLDEQPLFVAFSAAMHSLIIIDEEGKPLTRCIIWADNRAAGIADRLKQEGRAEALYQSTGVPVHAMSPLCKILWLKTFAPQIFLRAKKFIGIKEYFFFKLFGEYVVDTSVASATGLLKIESLQWDKNVLDFVGISESQLPALKKVTDIFLLKKNNAVFKNLSADLPFIIGGSDGALANLGTGANANSMTVSIGTSSAARIIVSKPHVDDHMRTFCYHVKDEQYIIGGPSNNGAVVLSWLKDSLLQTTQSFDELYQKAAQVDAGSNGLLFIPYILGERAPIWDSAARGVFFGLDIKHSQGHLIRACMEGVVYAVYNIAKVLFEKTTVTEIYAAGGFTKSAVWLQMLADVYNRKVLVSDAVESSALGAVMLGIEALAKEPLSKKRHCTTYEPNPDNHKTYSAAFEKFEAVYQLLKDQFTREVTPPFTG